MEIYKRMINLLHMRILCLIILSSALGAEPIMADNSVGTIDGILSVSELGAAIYNVPIEIMPSETGFDPQIGLSYNSQLTGYGNVGYGVSITGISSITRTGKDPFHDNSFHQVKYQIGDNYMLDGKRLYLKSGIQGRDGSIYTPEGNPYAEVTLHGDDSIGSTSVWFEFKDTDGNTYKYEQRQRCYFGYPTQAYRTVAWYITSASNKYHDQINYSYSMYDNCLYPQQIVYGRTGERHSVSFAYANLTSPQTFIMEGGTVSMISKRLSTITVKCKTRSYRKYSLAYNTTSDASVRKYDRLQSISVENGSGETLAPLTFSWNHLRGANISRSTQSVSTQTFHGGRADDGNSYFFTADLNNDGVSDIIRMWEGKEYYYYYNSNNNSWHQEAYAYISMSQMDANGNVSYQSPTQIPIPISINFGEVFDREMKTESGGGIVCNLDGDAFNDIVLPYYDTFSGENACFFSIFRGCEIGSNGTYQPRSIHGLLDSANKVPLFCTIDLNADGKDEIVFIEQKKSGSYYKGKILTDINFSESTVNPINLSFTYSRNIDIEKMFLADCNADGLQDIILIFDGGYKIYFNNGGSNLSSIFNESNTKTVASSFSLKNYWRMQQGDFNGDGLLDFVVCAASGNKMGFLFNNGNGTFTEGTKTDVDFGDNTDSEKDNAYFTLRIADFDKDGRSDIMVSKKHLYDASHWYESTYYRQDYTQVRWFRSDGVLPIQWSYLNKSGDDDCNSSEAYIFSGDFNGDGYTEIANYGSPLNSTSNNTLTENIIYIYSFPTDVSLGRIASITNGFGKVSNLVYANGTNPSVYLHTNSCESLFPINTYTMPLPLVSSVTQTNGAAGTETVKYKYSGLKAHVQGRGLLGFTSLIQSNLTLGSTIETHITSWNDSILIPETILSTTTIGERTSTSSIRNETYISPEGNYFSYCKENLLRDFYGHETCTVKEYDLALGVLTKDSTNYDGLQDMYKKTQYQSYVYPNGKYVPTIVITTQQYNGDPEISTVINTYTYDTKGDIVRNDISSEYNGSNISLTTYYFRNSTYGNLSAERTYGSNVRTIEKRYEYDTNYLRLVKSFVTPSYFVTTYEYDDWGNLISQKDESDASDILTTTYVYDNWGRVIKTLYPDGTQSGVTTTWNRSRNNSVYMTVNTATAQAPVMTYYDSEGREVYSESMGIDRVSVTQTTGYNTRGLPTTTTIQNGQLTLSETKSYDDMGRITTSSNTDGSVSTFQYGDRCTTTTSPTGTTTRTYDAWGNVLSVTDQVSSVNYSYNSLSLPVEVNAGDSNIQMEYDGAGRKTKLIDPDAGTMLYTYAADGTLLSQTDGRNITTTYSYDQFGRMTSKVCGGITQNIRYGTSGYGLNHIVEKSTNNGRSEFYNYNEFGDVTSITRNDNGRVFTTEYSYEDSTRLLSAVSYPGNVIVCYSYDEFGNIMSASANGRPYFSQGAYNGLKNVTYFGNLSSVARRYPSSGLLAYLSIVDSYGEELDRENYTYHPTSKNVDLRWRGAIAGNIMDEWYSHLDNGRSEYEIDDNDWSDDWEIHDNVVLPYPDDNLYDVGYFSYDNMDRLSVFTKSGPDIAVSQEYSISYANNGNINYKTGIGTYGYGTVRPHAVSSINQAESEISRNSHNITYTDEGKISQINNTLSIIPKYRYYYYGPDAEKWKTVDCSYRINDQTSTATSKTTYYFGDYECIEKNNAIIEQYYLNNGVILIKKDGELNFYKAFCDRQGSILSVFDIDGNKVFDAYYDAWGKQTVSQNDIDLQYGYCGHEMIKDFDLINMGGRVYDPVIGRFLSCDNYVQEPNNSQNFNRYSYCLNNPLRYSDPSGELFGIDDLILIGAVGAVINVGIQGWNGKINSPGDFFAAAGVGALAGIGAAYGGAYVASALATSIGTGFMGGMAAGAASSAISIGAIGYGNHWTLGTPVPSSNEWLLGVGGGALFGGVMSGISAWSRGGTFWTGKSKFPSVPTVDGSPVTAGAKEQLQNKIAQSSQINSEITLKTPIQANLSPEAIVEQKISSLGWNESGGGYSVYYGVDKSTGEVKYIGITMRDPQIRFAEHLTSRTPRADLRYMSIKVSGNFTEQQARIMEQTLINHYGLGKNGGALLNKINSIAPKYWDSYSISITETNW